LALSKEKLFKEKFKTFHSNIDHSILKQILHYFRNYRYLSALDVFLKFNLIDV